MLSDEEKAIERLNKRYEFFKENPLATNVWLTLDIHNLGIALNLIEKQSKEIEELKEELKKEKQYRKGLISTSKRVADKLWEDKIKAKIEEWDIKDLTICYGGRTQGRTFQQAVRTEVKKILQLLLEKE